MNVDASARSRNQAICESHLQAVLAAQRVAFKLCDTFAYDGFQPERASNDHANLAFLGVPPSLTKHGLLESQMDRNSCWGRLERPAQLPGRCRLSLQNESDRKKWGPILHQFWKGECTYLLIDPEETEFQIGGKTFELPEAESWIPDKSRTRLLRLIALAGEGGKLAIVIFTIMQGLGPMGPFQYLYTGDNFFPTKPHLMTQADQELLHARTQHHFLRQFAWHMDWDLLVPFFNHLQEVYCKYKLPLENLDLNILQGDLLHNFEMNDSQYDPVEIGHYMVGAAEALETLGRYEEAAALYQEIAMRYATGDELESISLGNAGMALKRAGKYEQAFDMYAKALQALDWLIQGVWNFELECINLPLSNMLSLYKDVHFRLLFRRKGTRQFLATKEETLFPVLAMLLHAIGFSSMDCEVQEALQAIREGTFSNILQPGLQQPKLARRLLCYMFKTGDFNRHKEALLSTAREDYLVVQNNPDLKEVQKGSALEKERPTQEPTMNTGIQPDQRQTTSRLLRISSIPPPFSPLELPTSALNRLSACACFSCG